MTQTIGSRRQVWNGTAKRTSGGLTKSDLMMSHGRIVSKSKHFSAKKEMRLLKYGYGTQKGKFGYVKVGTKKHRKGSKKMRGGHVGINSSLSPSGIDGAGITDFGSGGLQTMAGMAGGSGMRSAGGSFGSANWNGDGIAGAGITNFGSGGLQTMAGMAGGKGRSKGRGRGRGKGRSMRGGTTKPFAPNNIGSPLNQALGAS